MYELFVTQKGHVFFSSVFRMEWKIGQFKNKMNNSAAYLPQRLYQLPVSNT